MSNVSPFALKINDLSCGYDPAYPILDRVNLELQAGEFLALLGPSGSGKSTLLRSIAGLVTPQSGQIEIYGREVFANGHNKIPVEKRQVGLVFQDYALFPHYTVYENVAFGLRQQSGVDPQYLTERVMSLLEEMGIAELAARKPNQLSGGQQQRVAVARALAPSPRLLLMDEPFANVEAGLRQDLGEALQMLVRTENVSVLLVTHDRSEAFALADKIAILDACEDERNIVQYDTPQQVYQRPVNRCVAELTGPVALLPGIRTQHEVKTMLGTFHLLPEVKSTAQNNGFVVLRPEMVEFSESPKGNAEIIARQFLGYTYRLLCKTPAGNIFAHTTSAILPHLGVLGDLLVNEPVWWIQG